MAGGALLDHALGGFSVKAKLQYLKNIKKVLAKHPKLEEPMMLGGFGFKLGVKAKVDLTFDDPEDITNHPMVGPMGGMTFENIFEQMGADKSTFEGYSSDLSGIDEAKLKAADEGKFDELSEREFECIYFMRLANCFAEFLKSMDNSFKLEVDVSISDLMHAEAKVKSDGVCNLGLLAFNAVTMQEREWMRERIT